MRRVLLQHQRRLGNLQRRCASRPLACWFSSATPNQQQHQQKPPSPPPSDPHKPNHELHPSVTDGLDGIVQFAQRVLNRLDTYQRYRQHDVFPPETVTSLGTFLSLNLPTHTQVDALEFLDGAQFACDFVMHCMYSTELINFACGVITQSPAADKLQQCVSPKFFKAFTLGMKDTHASGNQFELQALEIQSIYITDCGWDRMPKRAYELKEAEEYADAQAELADRSNTAPTSTTASSTGTTETVTGMRRHHHSEQDDAGRDDADEMVEVLTIDVQLNTREQLVVQTADGQEVETTKNNQTIWRFESLVTQPDDLDWRITAVY